MHQRRCIVLQGDVPEITQDIAVQSWLLSFISSRLKARRHHVVAATSMDQNTSPLTDIYKYTYGEKKPKEKIPTMYADNLLSDAMLTNTGTK